MHRVAGLLIDPSLIKGLAPSKSHVPPLPLLNCSKANNVALWLETRLIFKDFGLQFFHRVQAYATFWFVTMLAMIVFLLYQIVLQKAPDVTGIILVCYDLLVIMCMLLALLSAANTLNKQHVEHRKILLKKLCDMQRHVSLLTATDAATQQYARAVEQTKNMVKVTIQAIETEDQLNPVQIMGFNADANLVRALVTASGSGLIAAAKLLTERMQ